MKELMEKLQFNAKEQSFFMNLYLNLDKDVLKELDALKKVFFMTDTNLEFLNVREYVNENLSKLADGIGYHKFSMHLIFLLYCCGELKENYDKAGIDSTLYYNLISDITCKLRECEQIYNIMGISCFNWFHNQFLMKLFALGRFQYVKGEFHHNKDYNCGEITVKPGDSVYYIHIPSSGSMTKEQRFSSYKLAYDFLDKDTDGYIVFVCESWLLYPQNKFVFPENSNLMGFLNDFDIISSYEHEEPFRNAWRIFYKDFDGDTSVLPRDTTLQKNYIKWLDAGNKVGIGYGIIIFDGEKILNK